MSCLYCRMVFYFENSGADFTGGFRNDKCGACCRYMVKLRNKHNLKKENAKLQKKAELRKNILAEIKMERGNESVRASKDDGV